MTTKVQGNMHVPGKQTIWIPASALTSRTTDGASSATFEATTNKECFGVKEFDAATQQYATCVIQMPTSWNLGTITAKFVWMHPSTTTNFGVRLGIRGIALSNDDNVDQAFGTAVYVSDTGGTTEDVYVTDETAAITIGGTPALQDLVVLQVDRDVAHADDTMAVACQLIGISLYYTVGIGTDA